MHFYIYLKSKLASIAGQRLVNTNTVTVPDEKVFLKYISLKQWKQLKFLLFHLNF